MLFPRNLSHFKSHTYSLECSSINFLIQLTLLRIKGESHKLKYENLLDFDLTFQEAITIVRAMKND